MAAPKLDEEQREALLMWLAAEYDTRLIRKWFAAREWPELSRPAFAYYRKRYNVDIEALRTERRNQALNSGVALVAERVARLAAHVDELEAIKWTPDEHGRLWNEKAWRETLDDVAKEMGHRRQGLDVNDITDYADVSASERKAKLQAELDRLAAFEAWERSTARPADAESGLAEESEA